MDNIKVSKDQLTIAIYELREFYRGFSIDLNNKLASNISKAKFQTPGKGFLGFKISYTTPRGYIENNKTELREIEEMFSRRRRLLNAYNSLHYSLYARHDEEFEKKTQNEVTRLKGLISQLQEVLQYDFEFNI